MKPKRAVERYLKERKPEDVGVDCQELAERAGELFVDGDAFVKRIDELIAEQESTDTEELALVDGRTYVRNYRPLELPDGDGHLWIYRDITGRKEREQTLERERDRLDEFASVVSHDLQSPLGVAKGRLELAQEECGSEHIDAIETAIDRMERIIEDVLWLARSGRDIESVESVALGNAIDSAWGMVSDGQERAEIVGVDELTSVEIQADADRLRQLLENLLRNAIEHSSGDVTVTVGILANGIYIEDDGPGVPEAQLEDVFSPGYSSDENGTGFGLSIVKRIAEAHGWHITVTEAAEGGARFEISGLESTGS